ncbi:MAG: AbrB/MazE/SpoVT family DNA-binding domain-containing protein [Gemmatimonadales bacterium]
MDAVGRLVVPKRIRDRLGVSGATELELTEVDGAVVLRPAGQGPRLVERDGILVAESPEGGPPITRELVREILEQERK